VAVIFMNSHVWMLFSLTVMCGCYFHEQSCVDVIFMNSFVWMLLS
jgi:hypothetical protein